mmetsp:Transcript_62855/g.161801  ORF Transcript_62855/g.161801 Transcript_62855/m.161801 type:complete len:210 (+) Transcript_62855:437-1066(+)
MLARQAITCSATEVLAGVANPSARSMSRSGQQCVHIDWNIARKPPSWQHSAAAGLPNSSSAQRLRSTPAVEVTTPECCWNAAMTTEARPATESSTMSCAIDCSMERFQSSEKAASCSVASLGCAADAASTFSTRPASRACSCASGEVPRLWRQRKVSSSTRAFLRYFTRRLESWFRPPRFMTLSRARSCEAARFMISAQAARCTMTCSL